MGSGRFAFAVTASLTTLFVACGSGDVESDAKAPAPTPTPTATPTTQEELRPAPRGDAPVPAIDLLPIREPPHQIRHATIPDDPDLINELWFEYLSNAEIVATSPEVRSLIVLCADGTGVVNGAGSGDPDAEFGRGSEFEWRILRSPFDPSNTVLFMASKAGTFSEDPSSYNAGSSGLVMDRFFMDSPRLIDTRFRWSEERGQLEHTLVTPEFSPEWEQWDRFDPEADVVETNRCEAAE